MKHGIGRKLLSVVLAVMMLVSLLPTAAFADDSAEPIVVNSVVGDSNTGNDTKLADEALVNVGDTNANEGEGEKPVALAATNLVTVNGIGYATLADAIANATPDENGVITYEINGKADISGNDQWISFVKDATDVKKVVFIGKSSDAEISITSSQSVLGVQDMDIDVELKDLTLSHPNGAWVNDLGHATNYFSCIVRNAGHTVTYTNCTFPDGACNSQYGKTVFDNCHFTNNTSGKYNLWNYGGNTEIKNSSFTGTRGVKTYNEGTLAVAPTVKIENTSFDGLTEKAAIVASKATDITLTDVSATDCSKGLLTRDISGNDELTITANGNSISGTFDITSATGADAAKNEFNITAGTFNSEVSSDYCAEGFTVVKNTDGSYGVKEDTASAVGTEDNPYTLAQLGAMTRAEYIAAQERLNGTMYVTVGDYSYETNGVLGNGVRNDTPGQTPDHSKLNAYGENGYLGEKNDGANGKNIVFVGGSITSGVTGYASIDNIGTSLLLAVPAYTNVTFKGITFNNVMSFNYQLYTSPWSQLGELKFDGCTFNGIIVGAIAAQTLTFNSCTFTNYTNQKSANNSNPTWIRPAYGNWTKGDNEGQGGDFKSLTTINFTGNTVTSTRPVKFEFISQWDITSTVTATGNYFDISKQDGDDTVKNVGLYLGAHTDANAFNLVAEDNTKSANTAALYTIPEGETSLPLGSTVKDTKGNEVELTDALKWKAGDAAEDKIVLKTVEAVASIGDAKYASLAAAIAAANNGDTVTLLKDLDLSATGLTIAKEKAVTLDLNGKTLKVANTNSGNIKVFGKLTLQDSTDTAKNGAGTGKVWTETPYISGKQDKVLIAAIDGGTFIMESGLIDAASFTADNTNKGQFAVSVQNENADATVIINGGCIKAGWYAIAGNGQDIKYNGNITVNGGILESTADYAIYHPHSGTTTINGGVVFGAAGGVSLNRGKLMVNGGTITSKGTGTTGDWGDGTGNQNAAAINVNAQYGSTSVEIKGGKITAEKDAILLTNGKDGTISVSGGTFSSAVPAKYCAEGFIPKDNGDGTYGVKAGAYAAQIGDAKYASLAAAIAAAKDGETVKLLADATEDVVINKSITLDLNGKTLTNTNAGKATISVTGGKVTVKGGSVMGGTSYYNIEVTKGSNANLTLENVTATAGNTGSSMIDNWGTLTIESGTYKGGLNVVKSEEGSVLTINGGTFTRDWAPKYGVTGTILVYGTTTIKDGTFIDKSTSNNARVVVTGVVEGYTSITYVKGGSFTRTGSGNIFHGLGKATSDNFEVSGGTFNKSISDGFCADGFIPTKNADGTYGVKEGKYVAQVGKYNKYESLAEAISHSSKSTIKLLANVTENVTIPAGKTITLDLNGCILNGGTGTAKAALTNLGTITITDSSTAKTGTIKRDDKGTVGETSYYVIRNKGTMTIESGTVINNSGYKQASSIGSMNGSSLICNGDCDEGGTLTIKGGTFTQNNFIAIKNGALGVLHVTGGTITSNHSAIQNWFKADITGGEIKGQLWTDAYIEGESVGQTTIGGNANFTGEIVMDIYGSVVPKLAINGGNLDVTSWRITTAAANAGAKPAISGGTFKAAVPADYCAEGFIPTKNADGTYGVKQDTYVAETNGTKYESLQAAIDAAGKNATVTMLADTRENVTIANAMTLDLNGFTLNGGTVAGKPALTVTARGVTVKDSSAAQTGTIMREDTAENSGVSSHYVIDVQGNSWLTFEGGNVKNGSGVVGVKGASLVRVGDDSVKKYPGLVINGGTFTQDNFIVIKVDRGYLNLNGGTLKSANSYAVENWFNANIKGGTVNGAVSSWTYSGGSNSTLTISGGTVNEDVTSVNYGDADKVAKVEITGGTVNGKLDTRSYDPKTGELTSIVDAAKATIKVSGGTFANAVETRYCDEGYTPVQNSDGKYGVEKAYLAKIGDTSYYTMDEAFQAVKEGETITLLRDYTTGAEQYSGSKSFAIDLNGKTWTYTGTNTNHAAFEINHSDVTLTVKNGTVVSNSMVGLIPSAMGVGSTITYDNAGLVFEGVTMTANGHSGIETNGNNTNDTVTLKNSTLNVPNGFGIYFPSSGTLTIENSTINAKTMGVQVCAGSLNISGDQTAITVSGDAVPKTENDGAIQDGAAISIVNRTGYKGLENVTVTGGKFKSNGTNAAIKAYDWDNTNKVEKTFTANDKVAVSGGTFSSAVKEEYCAPGYIPTTNSDGTYGVKEGVYVAKVDNVKYETLQAAINAAKDGSTVRLLANVTLTETAVFPAGKKVDLNLVGHNITATGTALRINGTTEIQDTNKTGIIESTGNVAVAVGNNASLTVYSGTLKGREGAVITGTSTGAKIEIRKNATLIATDNAVIAGNGSQRDGNPNTILVKGGTFIGGIVTTGYIACGIYAPWNDNVTVSGGTFKITNGAGIVARAGTVKVTNGTFNCTGTAEGYVGDSKNKVPCAALVFDRDANYPALTESSQILVSGGSFSTDPAANGATLADGYVANKDESGMYKVAKSNPVAEINGDKYDTLSQAIAALEDKGGTIKLLQDINAPSMNYRITENITIDLNGHNITGNGAEGVFYVYTSGHLTITGDGVITAVENNKAAIAVQVYSEKAKVTLEGGTYKQKITNINDPHFDLIYVYYGTAEIKGGTYDGATPDWTLNCKDENYQSKEAKIEVTGGTFVGFDPANNTAEGEGTNFVPAGYVSTKGADGNYTVEKVMVAQIGEVKYGTLSEAITAATDGDTITLLADIDLDEQIATAKAITIDGQGKYTIKATKKLVGASGKAGMFYRTGGAGTLTFLNVTLDGNGVSKIFLNEGGAGETVFDGVTSINGGGIAYGSGIHISGGGSHATIRNSTLTGSKGTMELNEANYYAANDLWVGGNVYVTVENSTIGTVFVNSAPSATATNGVVHGQLTITGENTKITYLSGEEEAADKLDKFGNNGSLVKIDSGYVETIFDMGSYEISGGTFKTEVKPEWCAEGFIPHDNGDGTYTVKSQYVAMIGDTKYTTLSEALKDAAKNGGPVLLVADVDANEDLVRVKYNVTLDLNGHSITNADMLYVNGQIKDSASVKGFVSAVDYVINDLNAYTPVYNSAEKGYSFFNLGMNSRWDTTENKAKFALKNTNDRAAAVALMVASADDRRVKAVVTFSWEEQGTIVEQSFTFLDTKLSDYLTTVPANQLYVVVNGLDQFTAHVDMQTKFVIYKENGAELFTLAGESSPVNYEK